MSPKPTMTIGLSVETYRRLSELRDAWNNFFFDGKQSLGVNSVVLLILMHYNYVDDSGKAPTFDHFERWLQLIPKRGRPRMTHPKPRSRPPNPLGMDVMMDRGG